MRACAGPEPGSSMPHGTRRACRACRIGDANGNAAQTGGLARQVRQRMNRLGKPEHRARFCFFSKKKSHAGTRRFPTTPEIQIPMGFNFGTLNPRSTKNPSPTTALRRRLRHRARRNYHCITPCYMHNASRRLRHHTPSNHCICCPLRISAPLGVALLRACAGPEPGSNMPHSTRRVCRAAARGMQAETPPKQAALARQVRQRMNRLGKPEHRARFCFFSKKKSLAGMRRFPIPSKSRFRRALKPGRGSHRATTGLPSASSRGVSPPALPCCTKR